MRRSRLIKFLTAASLLLSLCPEAHAIFNGQRVAAADPIGKTSVAILVKINGRNSFCTGIVLQPDVVLTAAHCLDGADARDASVLLGTLVLRKGDTDPTVPQIAVQKAFVPAKYKQLSDNDLQEKPRVDIAILKLANPLPSQYQPAVLELDKTSYEKAVTLSGFGAQSSSGPRRNVMDPMASGENTELRFVEATAVAADSEILKIDQKNGGVCVGDSGGGMYDARSLTKGQPVVVALNSRAGGNKGKLCDAVSFGLRLVAHKVWIQSTLKAIHSGY